MWLPTVFYIFIILSALIRPIWGLIGLLASLLIRFQDRYEAIAAIPTFQIIVLALFLGMFIHKDKINAPKLKLDRLIAAFAMFAFVGILLMNISQVGQQMSGLLSSILVYYFITRIVTSRQQLMFVLVAVAAVTTGMGIESLISFYSGPDSPFSNPTTGRLQGLGYYANANEFGKLMCTAIPFAAVALARGRLFTRLTATTCIIIMLIVIGETLSRTCYVTVLIVAASAVMLRGSGKIFRKMIIASVAGFVLLVGLSYLPGPLQERASSILNYSSDTSFQGRVRAWDQGFQMVSWYPVFGVGKGQWMEYHGRAPHNSYVQVMAETGIPGILLFISIIWVSFKGVLAPLRSVPNESLDDLRHMALGIASSYVGYLFYILLGNQGYSPWTYFYFGLCAVTYHLFSQSNLDSANPQQTSSKGNLGALR